MPKKITTKKGNEEKERNCRTTICELLRLIGFQCPTTDATILRAEAEHKLNEIKKSKLARQDSNSPESVVAEINKVECDESITTSTFDSMDSRSTSRFNHCGGKCRKVMRFIEEIQGAEIVESVFEKKLTYSDVNPSQGRLLMPLKQVRRPDILKLMQKAGAVRLYVLSRLQHYDVCLTHWDMSTNQNYVLKSGWNKVVKENALGETMVVQLWSIQVGDIPSLLLLLVDGNNGVDGDSCDCNCTISSDECESSRAIGNDA
uniref:TF-B3 domain-containing protein n=1 Tax=Lactuca sativa TaxID=4236 RepID=A0A9R1W1W3_LACSA|nr:hypothetical protein LSAT_V11C300131310 [Lactuca sativa]